MKATTVATTNLETIKIALMHGTSLYSGTQVTISVAKHHC